MKCKHFSVSASPLILLSIRQIFILGLRSHPRNADLVLNIILFEQSFAVEQSYILKRFHNELCYFGRSTMLSDTSIFLS